MPAYDAEATRRVRAELTRRYIDSSMIDVRVIGGVVHLTGIIRHLRTHRGIDLNLEMDHITHILRQRPGIRDVVWEVTIRS
jgi:osmotically-inducible protein OsmY